MPDLFLKFRKTILTPCLTILSISPVLQFYFLCILPTFHSKFFVDILTMLAQSRVLDFKGKVISVLSLVNYGIFPLIPCTKYNLLMARVYSFSFVLCNLLLFHISIHFESSVFAWTYCPLKSYC